MALKLTEADAKRLGIPGSGKGKTTKGAIPLRVRGKASSSKSPPQDKLFHALQWHPDTRRFAWLWEYARPVPGRKFSLDIALVLSARHRLALEVDGMRHHGINRDGFYRDREKDFLLEANFWRVVRIPAGMILKDIATVLERVTAVACQLEGQYLRHRLEQLPLGYVEQWKSLCEKGFPGEAFTLHPLPSHGGWLHRHHAHRTCHGGCSPCPC